MPDPDAGSVPSGEDSALAWADRWLQSDANHPVDAATPGPSAEAGDPDAASTGANATDVSVTLARFGGYDILERVGRGGMGTVYRARQLGLGRVVALKVISPGNWDDSAVRTRFEREYQALAEIDHPNIVPVYDAGSWDGFPYFAMKYVPGGALNRHLRRFRADPAATARLLAKVARAVHRVHQAGLLHRDLKPHNILIGDGDEPLVADFGLVKRLGDDSDASMTGAPMGTHQYMSPEQTWGQRADYTPACDVWALGVILYELLAGARPFTSPDLVGLCMAIRAEAPAPVAAVNPAAPEGLVAVADRCLAKKPGDRYPSAAAVADDLEAWLTGGAVTATLPLPTVPVLPPAPTAPPATRPTLWPSRRRAAIVLGLLLAIAVTATIIWRVSPVPLDTTTRTPQPKPVAERLAAGETVEFVKATGGALLPTRLAPETDAPPTVRPDGLLSLNSAGLAAIELYNGPLPPGTQLEAEVATTLAFDDRSAVGVYAGGVAWQTPAGSHSSMVALTFCSAPDLPTMRLTDRYGFAQFLRRNQHPNGRNVLPLRAQPTAALPAESLRWQTVRLTPHPGELHGSWDGTPVPVAKARPVEVGRRVEFPDTPPDTPVFGTGIGLVVHHAGAVFRNVRLVPAAR